MSTTQTEEKQKSSKPSRPGNIYDAFVKNIFGRVVLFVDFLLNYADPYFVNKIDFDKITATPTHYVDPNGIEWILDLVFSCPLKNNANAKCMVVLEHAGSRFESIPIRLLFYAFSIWSLEAREGKKTLSALYFIVLRTGKTPYCGEYPKVSDFLTKDENGQVVGFDPELLYTVIDLPAIDLEDLSGKPESRVALGILKNMTEGHEKEFAKAMLPLAEMEDEQQQFMLMKDVLNFVSRGYNAHGERLEPDEIKKAISPILGERTESTMKTFFEELEERGRVEGRVEGRTEGERDVILLALRTKFAVIPDHIETTINQMSDPVALKSLIGDVIVSQSLDEFATALK